MTGAKLLQYGNAIVEYSNAFLLYLATEIQIVRLDSSVRQVPASSAGVADSVPGSAIPETILK